MTDSTTPTCADCGASWDGGPIPQEMRHHYAPPYRWGREIAIYDQRRDRTVALRCPDCGHETPVAA